MKFQYTEALTPVLLMNHLQSLRLREVWIWINTVLKTYFPKDRNCEICKRTKITKAPCRRRIGGVVPRPESFGDLITADYKVLSEGCESRNNHRYAVVVQLGNSVDPILSVQHKNFSGNGKELTKVLGADEETKSHLH